jgi:hypothetical protein
MDNINGPHKAKRFAGNLMFTKKTNHLVPGGVPGFFVL